MPTSYIAVFERRSPENIIFASSNCEQVIGYRSDEMVGTSAMSYSADTYAKHYSCEWPEDNPELGVTLLPHNLRHKNGSVIFTHSIAINCSGLIFTFVKAFPEFGYVPLGQSILYKLQHETDYEALDASKSRSSIDSSGTTADEKLVRTEGSAEELVSPPHPKITKDSLSRAHVFTARASRIKAVLLCHQPLATTEDGVHGPKIEYSTNTISNIYGGDVEAHELIGHPFFSLVVPEDITKAAMFMDSLFSATQPQLCVLRLLRHPTLEEVPAAGRPATSQAEAPIEVEVFGASSERKVILLCQRIRKQQQASRTPAAIPRTGFADSNDDLGYMSLGEIISSDPDSSDINEQWFQVPL
ncbi:hypothetical protein GGF46_001380 [Coemansia sp. RSA 552]|nr:hypothetical protein GGF46_001380 [Coemansia sp. RSA 552]